MQLRAQQTAQCMCGRCAACRHTSVGVWRRGACGPLDWCLHACMLECTCMCAFVCMHAYARMDMCLEGGPSTGETGQHWQACYFMCFDVACLGLCLHSLWPRSNSGICACVLPFHSSWHSKSWHVLLSWTLSMPVNASGLHSLRRYCLADFCLLVNHKHFSVSVKSCKMQVDSGKLVRTLKVKSTQNIQATAWSPQGSPLVSLDKSGVLVIWQ